MNNAFNRILQPGFLGLLLMSAATVCFGQDQAEKEKIREMEIQRQMDKQRKVTVQLDSAVRLSDEGNYEEADEKFKWVLKNIRSVPSDLTFHFGKNSYLLGNFKQSIDWLNKYIQLKGTAGQYSQEAVEWMKKAEIGLLREKEIEAQQAVQVLSKDYEIDCGPSGKVVCPICKGSTVIVKKNYVGDTYKTCPYCSRHGYLTCEDYNKLLKGELHADPTN